MVFYKIFSILLAACLIFGCAKNPPPSTPLETLKAYTQAIKRKNLTEMKLLLSDSSLKMAQAEAKEQNVTVDEIIKKQSIFNESQTRLEFRNEKIEGEQASIEMRDSMNSWITVPFVREEKIWKIDNQSLANQKTQEIEEESKRELDKIINQGKIP